jgi:hypothetical protein
MYSVTIPITKIIPPRWGNQKNPTTSEPLISLRMFLLRFLTPPPIVSATGEHRWSPLRPGNKS